MDSTSLSGLNGQCAICHRVLDWETDLDGSNGHWVHTFQDRLVEDHEPVWAPEGTDTEFRCDFCNLNGPTFFLPCSDFQYPSQMGVSVGEWLACGECAPLISQGQWLAVGERAITVSPTIAYQIREGLMSRHQARELINKIYRLVREHATGPLQPWTPGREG